MAQGRSTAIMSMIQWTRTSRLSIKISLSAAAPLNEEEDTEYELSVLARCRLTLLGLVYWTIPYRELSAGARYGALLDLSADNSLLDIGWGLWGILAYELSVLGRCRLTRPYHARALKGVAKSHFPRKAVVFKSGDRL